MADFSSIQTALQGGPVGLILAMGLFVRLAAPGVAQLIDAWTRRDWMKRGCVPIPIPEGKLNVGKNPPPTLSANGDN